MTARPIHLGTQYYRPPFPRATYWEDDFRKMADSGLNTVQLWVLWSWVEAVPGQFNFEDYDRLVDLAGKYGLEVVLSTIAEVQPYWIHREVPGSEMITNMGTTVVSSNRCECHFGLTPGGCTDHPEVWRRMRGFLTAVGERYAGLEHLAGWDVWNELRWNVQSDGPVCYCEHTLNAFREWLVQQYGGLNELNEAWLRRYGQWDEVMPGKKPGRPYTEMMAWQHFLTWRACQHARARYDVMKGVDPVHPVTLHGGAPSPDYGGGGDMTPLDRGNDWHFADVLDGVGCSSFPKWFHIDDADFGMRIEFVRSAARGKAIWLSELQGGRSAQGFEIHDPVDALSQQRWIWNGLACGADTILFWCWRDEVFTREAGGYGLIGLDGLAEQRLAAMRHTGRVLREHADILANYAPDDGTFGVLFSPQSYYYYGAQEGHAGKPQAALRGVCRALVRNSIPFKVVEEEHLEEIDELRVVYLPRATALTTATKDALIRFVKDGGILVAESECGAFDEAGIYSYPEDRFLAQAAGLCEVGRRQLVAPTLEVNLPEGPVEINVTQWLTPVKVENHGESLASNADGDLVVKQPLGEGAIVCCGAYPSDAYCMENNEGFEKYLRWIAGLADSQASVKVVSPSQTRDSFVYVKMGRSRDKRVLFVFFPDDQSEAVLRFDPGVFRMGELQDLMSGEKHVLEGNVGESAELTLQRPDAHFAVLVETD